MTPFAFILVVTRPGFCDSKAVACAASWWRLQATRSTLIQDKPTEALAALRKKFDRIEPAVLADSFELAARGRLARPGLIDEAGMKHAIDFQVDAGAMISRTRSSRRCPASTPTSSCSEVRPRRSDDRLVLLVALLAVWQLATLAFGRPLDLSPTAGDGPPVPASSLGNGELLWHACSRSAAAAGGFLVGGVPGAVLPFAAASRAASSTAILDPYLVAGYGMPKLALAPLFILWFGIDLAPRSRWSPASSSS